MPNQVEPSQWYYAEDDYEYWLDFAQKFQGWSRISTHIHERFSRARVCTCLSCNLSVFEGLSLWNLDGISIAMICLFVYVLTSSILILLLLTKVGRDSHLMFCLYLAL